MDLSGRGVLITGGTRIGAAVAVDLAGAGADVALVYRRSLEEAEKTAAAVRALGRRSVVIQADLSKASECRRVVDEAAARLGRLDVLVNMASLYERKDYAALAEDDWDRALAVDLKAAHLCTQAAVPHLRHQGGGRVVNFTDWVAASGRPRYTGYVPYYVAKMGVIGLTQILALELAADGILVNAVAPGPILAPPGTSVEEIAAVEKATPLGRWGGAAEIAKAVRFLVETDFVTGEVVRVDGGRHIK
jgi:NAD(P)-dependent dehydrogenase (short-subunit alcohol dehydrogenase family)